MSSFLVATYSIITGFMAVILAVVASAIIFELNRDKETALRRFHLNQEDSIMDFRVFMYANLAMVVVFTLFWIGSLLQVTALRGLSTYSLTLYAVFLVLLFARWWRRF
ncbi:hypothetical protein AQV86_03555 [Nanohaloarchaea archaeon SG9]|nr:hypothetical protein AQV86_03555 [Nanohaloarchaea archaeon SG9]